MLYGVARLSCTVRDAASRLPNGEGTRVDVSTIHSCVYNVHVVTVVDVHCTCNMSLYQCYSPACTSDESLLLLF